MPSMRIPSILQRVQVYSAVERVLQSLDLEGVTNTCALVSEYIEGVEYAVDGVSRDGVHKCVCIWRYDTTTIITAEP
jgi:hypothetical protein